jgi:hypothetical protein
MKYIKNEEILSHAALHAHSHRKEWKKVVQFNRWKSNVLVLTSWKCLSPVRAQLFSLIKPVSNRKCIIHNRKNLYYFRVQRYDSRKTWTIPCLWYFEMWGAKVGWCTPVSCSFTLSMAMWFRMGMYLSFMSTTCRDDTWLTVCFSLQ